MNGLELIARLRQERPTTRLLLMSGQFPPDTVSGIQFLKKPLLPADLNVRNSVDCTYGAKFPATLSCFLDPHWT